MTFLHLLILVLATFRLTLLLTKDSGPGWVMKKFRSFVRRKAPKKAHLDEGVSCPWCASIWFGIIITAGDFTMAGNRWFEGVVLAMALSGGAIILNQSFTKGP